MTPRDDLVEFDSTFILKRSNKSKTWQGENAVIDLNPVNLDCGFTLHFATSSGWFIDKNALADSIEKCWEIWQSKEELTESESLIKLSAIDKGCQADDIYVELYVEECVALAWEYHKHSSPWGALQPGNSHLEQLYNTVKAYRKPDKA